MKYDGYFKIRENKDGLDIQVSKGCITLYSLDGRIVGDQITGGKISGKICDPNDSVKSFLVSFEAYEKCPHSGEPLDKQEIDKASKIRIIKANSRAEAANQMLRKHISKSKRAYVSHTSREGSFSAYKKGVFLGRIIVSSSV